MSISDQIRHLYPECYTVLVLDNEVTLDAFITEPPLKWARLINIDGIYTIPNEYPTTLTKAESDREELNWDKVDLDILRKALTGIDDTIDLIAIGNNASQGLPLAEALPPSMRAENAAIIYGTSLPQQSVYETLGYKNFCAREDLLKTIAMASRRTNYQIALSFINTIEHNYQNYHAPWPPR